MKAGPDRAASRAIGALSALAILIVAPAASARDLYESDDGEYTLTLRSALKGSWLLAFPPDDPMVNEQIGGAALFRLRFELSTQLTHFVTAQVAYEHRALAASGTGIGFGLLPGAAVPPFRLVPLDWTIVDDSPSYTHRHEIDRAYLAFHFDFLELTIGRQAIGLGRGVIFSAIDMFAPFAPAEIDREWRRGVDAIRAEIRIPELPTLSAGIIAVFGSIETGTLQSYSLIGRLRAVVGEVDGELILGRRGEDNVFGVSLSATVADAEVHGEFALYGTDGRGIDGGFLGTNAVVAKGLLGGSYMIDFLRGIRVVLEYHYSGFGVDHLAFDPTIIADPFFQARFLRGDSQTIGRHTLALSLSTDLADELSFAVTYFQSPLDGSGAVNTTFTWLQSDTLTMVLSGAFPWGTPPDGGVPRSEWGSSPITIFLQARIYD